MTSIPRAALALAAMAPLFACGGTAGTSASGSTTSPDSGTPASPGPANSGPVLTVHVAGGKGSVSISGLSGAAVETTTCTDRCQLSLDEGSNALLDAKPDEGWVLDSWDGACSGWHGCAIQIDGAQTVTTRFRPAPQPANPIRYDALDLSRLDGPNAVTDAQALDDTGAVAGRICDAPPLCDSLKWDVFLWDGTVLRFRVQKGTHAWVTATAGGRVAGGLDKGDGSWRPFVSSGADLVELPDLGGGSSVYALNASGLAVGGSFTSSFDRHAVAWKDGSIIDLATRTGMPYGTALTVDERDRIGVVACRSARPPFACRVMILTDSGAVDLGAFPEDMRPAGMSISGIVVGATGPGESHAAVWMGGQMTDLDRDVTALPWAGIGARRGGQLDSFLRTVSPSGEAVGNVDIPISEGAAATPMLWKDGALFDLAAGVEPPMQLHSAVAINAKGQILARTGDRGYSQVLLTPK